MAVPLENDLNNACNTRDKDRAGRDVHEQQQLGVHQPSGAHADGGPHHLWCWRHRQDRSWRAYRSWEHAQNSFELRARPVDGPSLPLISPGDGPVETEDGRRAEETNASHATVTEEPNLIILMFPYTCFGNICDICDVIIYGCSWFQIIGKYTENINQTIRH